MSQNLLTIITMIKDFFYRDVILNFFKSNEKVDPKTQKKNEFMLDIFRNYKIAYYIMTTSIQLQNYVSFIITGNYGILPL